MKCIEDEIPFDLPEGWAWCRLSMVGTTNIGLTYKPTEVKETGTIVLRSCNIKNGKIDFADLVRVQADIRENQYIYENDILICARNGSQSLVGKCAIMQDLPEAASFGAFMAVFRSICNQYVYYYFNTSLFRSSFSNDDSKQINQVTQAILRDTLIPLPPFAEQTRIVAKLHEILSLADFINDGTEQIEMIITNAKNKILNLAIRGQLVPQDPDDEPASVLLERIRSEKEELIKAGKIKRDKKESIIFRGEDNSYYEKVGDKVRCIDTEIPFDLPELWTFARLKHIGGIVGGGTPKTNISKYWDGNIPWLTPADLSGYDSMYISTGSRTITDFGLKSSSAQMLPANSILYSSRAPIGYTAIATIPVCTNQGFKSVVPYDFSMSPYLYYCLRARTDNIIQRATGTTFKEISGSEMAETIIPIPPLNEQSKIIEKVTQLQEVISLIEKSLN